MPTLLDTYRLLKAEKAAEAAAAYRAYLKENPILAPRYATKPGAVSTLRLISGENAFVHSPNERESFSVTLQGHWEADHFLYCDAIQTTTLHVLKETDPAAIVRQAASAEIVVNCIADPDLHRTTLQIVDRACRSIKRPIINDPKIVLGHTRDQVSAALRGIPNLIVPKTARLGAGSAPDIERLGLHFPVIARETGTQTGASMELISDAAALSAYRDNTSGRELYLTQYFDFQSPDGLFRKYRVRVAGTRLCHNHMFFGKQWKVHGHASRELMKENPWMMAAEEDFMLGKDAITTKEIHKPLMEIHRRIGVDFYGIDFTVLPDDQVLLFEANASMRSIYPEWREAWPRTRQVSDELIRHVRAHICAKAGRRTSVATSPRRAQVDGMEK